MYIIHASLVYIRDRKICREKEEEKDYTAAAMVYHARIREPRERANFGEANWSVEFAPDWTDSCFEHARGTFL